jgi:nucleotide-binding universal stress UspA family protein
MEHVISIVRRTGARLKVVDVVEDPSQEMGLIPDTADLVTLTTTVVEDHRRSIEETVEEMAGPGVDVAVKVLVGSPALEIIREVLRGGHDLVVKSATGFATGIGGRLFGSTAIKLLRKCPCPVWIIKPAESIAFRRVLAAVDPVLAPGGDDRLNHSILSLASSIAADEAAHLDILHAWRMPGETLLSSGRTRMPDPQLRTLMEASESLRRARFGDLIGAHDFSRISVETHLQKGFPEMIIPAFVEAMEVDLIVMGTIVKTGIGGWITGNTAEKVLGVASCSVLAIKPPDFASPITV